MSERSASGIGSYGEKAAALLADLIRIPSFGGEEEAIVEFVRQRFEAQGIACRVSGVPGKFMNAVAEIGQGSRAIILNAHHDTVPPGDPALWASDPLTPVEKDGCVYGRGASDDKGNLAAMIVAFEELAKKKESLPFRVILQSVGAEERGGLGTKALVAEGCQADAAIVGESTMLLPLIAHKGVLRLEVEVKGKAAHASDPAAGINAIVNAAPIVVELEKLAAKVLTYTEKYTGHASLVISTISGGTALNVIPASCVFSIDRRVLPNETEEQATQEILDVVHAALPKESGATVEVRKVRFVPPSQTAPDAAVVAAAEEAASAVLGRPVKATGMTATCDMGYLVNGAGIPTIILGPGTIDIAHQANENISIEQMGLAVEIYLKTVDAWAKRG